MGYILDSLKALFTKNTTNAASVSGARVPIMSADGTPIGNDSLANLASVLGVIALNGNPGVAIDLNNCWAGIWYIRKTDYTVNNWPSTTNGLLVVINPLSMKNQQPNSYVSQIALDGSNKMYTRLFTNTWSSWREL